MLNQSINQVMSTAV